MTIPLNDEIKTICKKIIEMNLSLEEWAGIESDDMFQSKLFEGGFDATESEFVFSYFGEKEYWFQFSLENAKDIYEGRYMKLNGILAED